MGCININLKYTHEDLKVSSSCNRNFKTDSYCNRIFNVLEELRRSAFKSKVYFTPIEIKQTTTLKNTNLVSTCTLCCEVGDKPYLHINPSDYLWIDTDYPGYIDVYSNTNWKVK